jgi:hypothetical protein
MNPTEKERKLVDSLVAKTGAKKISWTESVPLGNPEALIGDHIIALEEGRNANGASLFMVVIMDKNYREIDRFDDEALDGQNRGGQYFTLLSELYERASKQARGAEDAIENLLKNIDDL